MTSEEIQELYKSTFGSMKDNEKSYKSFIDLLIKFNVISDEEYFDIKQRNSTSTRLDEKIELLRYRLKFIPLFENEDIDDKIGDRSYFAIKEKLNECEVVYIYTNKDENEYMKFVKNYDEMGIAKWVDVSSNPTKYYDEEFIVNNIYTYVAEKGYVVEKHGKYLDVTNKSTKEFFDKDGMYKKLMSFYIKIIGSKPVLENDWNDFLEFVEDAGIINYEQKISLYKHGSKE